MIIVGIFDGLGNQMFHYAFYRALKMKKKEVKIDIISTWNKYRADHNGYELNKIFKINIDIATAKERNYFLNGFFIGKSLKKRNFISKIRLRLLEKNKRIYIWKNAKEAITYNEKYFNENNIYYFSHYQSEKYFKSIEQEIRNDFMFPLIYDDKNKKLLDKIKNTNSVSLHVRRGDYVNIKEYYDVCSLAYYKNAIDIIRKNIKKPIFYIFSNDIPWCKKYFDITNIVFVDCNKSSDSFRDMQLMSYCKHNIIANSTFSWWGAWLNNNKEKMVMAPNRWFYHIKETCDIIPDNWYKVDIL